ncbi:MAG: hypothetical protein RLZZ385_2790 [Pseudomonadota bacterium]|jgi:arginine decarboxylase
MDEAKQKWTIDDARDLYQIEGWGIGYFDINERGHVTVHPTRDPQQSLDLFELSRDLEQQGVGLPVLLRFSDILRTRVSELAQCFAQAREEFDYAGGYTTVYPVKVNQQRHVVEEILAFGKSLNVGLEVGSKPELQAVLALTDSCDHLIICNGYKDEEFMRLALMGQKLGHQVFVVLEKISEVDILLRVAREMGVRPCAGVRIKLASTGSGKWAESGGERSKFGLTSAQLVRVIDKLRQADALDILKLIHFHIGSQIADIRSVKIAMGEVSRFYVELRKEGVEVTHVDVGGGLGVDYDGSMSTNNASVNYTIQEYANDIVYSLAEACREAELPPPNIISESGRALTAHHALLLINVIDLETHVPGQPDAVSEEAHALVHDLAATCGDITEHNLREVYHDASFAKDQAQQLFNSGVLQLRDRAAVERFYLNIMNQVAALAAEDPDEYDDIIPELDVILTDRYFCNFSLFQSLPDSWAIDQLFPILPVHRLDEEPTRRGTLQDVTCDSDGKIDLFIGGREGKKSLELHTLSPDEPYILGIFLTGAYQEILGDLHNLFGDTNAVHLRMNQGSEGYEITDLVHGDTITEVLNYVQFDAQALVTNFRRKIQRAEGLSRQDANTFIAEYIEGLAGYTYLEGS